MTPDHISWVTEGGHGSGAVDTLEFMRAEAMLEIAKKEEGFSADGISYHAPWTDSLSFSLLASYSNSTSIRYSWDDTRAPLSLGGLYAFIVLQACYNGFTFPI